MESPTYGNPTYGTFFAPSLSKKCPISWQMTVLLHGFLEKKYRTLSINQGKRIL